MALYTTGYSAPNSELDISSVANLSNSTESTTTVVPAPTKKARNDTIPEAAAMPTQVGSPAGGVDTTRASPALVATSIHVAHPNVYLNHTSSSSSVSVTSAASRQRRLDLARVRRELAEARLEEVEAELDFAAGSQAGSAGRRLDDVHSEVGSTRQEERPIRPLLHTDVAPQSPLVAEVTPNPFVGIFSLAATPEDTLPRTTEPICNSGLSAPSQEGPHQATTEVNPYVAALPTQVGADPPAKVAHYIGTPETSSEVVFPISFGSEWLVEVPIEVPTPSFTVNQQTIVNNCYDTQLAVESTKLEAEQRHQMAITQMAEHANLAHLQQMQDIRREANEALAVFSAATAAERCALELALQLKENEVTVLRQQGMHDSMSGGSSFHDLSSEKDSGQSQPGMLMSLATPAAPIPNVFGYKASKSEAPATVAPPSAGYAGSQVSGRTLLDIDLYDVPEPIAFGRSGGALPSQEGSPKRVPVMMVRCPRKREPHRHRSLTTFRK